ncbi:MAG: hypothetical protein AAF244_03715 [Pseudomonadota bacterium]
MIDLENFGKEDMKQLPKKAIKNIRSLCQGNGCQAKDVTLTKASGKMHQFVALTNLDLEPSIEQETKKGRHQVGEYIEDPSGLDKVLQKMTEGAMKNNESRKMLADIVLNRPGKGFGLQGETIEIEQLKKSYCTHEPCQTCEGVGNTICDVCRGQRKEPCNVCRTTGVIPCNYCHGSGYMQGPDGKQKQCNHCFGKRQTGCTTCQRTGYISCRTCKGSGTRTCRDCQGAAFRTLIAHLAVKMKTAFVYDRTELPPTAGIEIDRSGERYAIKEHLHIISEPIKRDDGGLAIQHQVTFPFGNIEFKVKNKGYTGQIMGFKAKIVKIPYFLTDLLQKPSHALEKATQNAAQAQNIVNKVIKFRFFADSIYLTTQMKPKKAYAALMKKYPLGARKDFYKESIMLSRKAVANASRSARWMAYGIGAGINLALFAAYFIAGLRDMTLTSLPNPSLGIIADVGCLAVGTILAITAAIKISRRPIDNILTRIKGSSKKQKIKIDLLPTIGISLGIFMVCALLAVLVFKTPILWLPL